MIINYGSISHNQRQRGKDVMRESVFAGFTNKKSIPRKAFRCMKNDNYWIMATTNSIIFIIKPLIYGCPVGLPFPAYCTNCMFCRTCEDMTVRCNTCSHRYDCLFKLTPVLDGENVSY